LIRPLRVKGNGMDPLLALILGMIAFAASIYMIHRAIKYVVIIGIVLGAFLVLAALGILG
jgi:hypothetical protein